MTDPFTPGVRNLGAEDADSQDAGRPQDPAGQTPEERSFLTQPELDANTDTSRDNHQTPRGNDAVRDVNDNLGQ